MDKAFSNDRHETASDALSDLLYGNITEKLQETEENRFLDKYKQYDTTPEEVESTEAAPLKFLDNDGNEID